MNTNISNQAAGQFQHLQENLTFGVEFEFLAYTPSNIRHPLRYLDAAMRQPVALHCSKCGHDHSWTLPVSGTLTNEAMARSARYPVWSAHRDETVAPLNNEQLYVPKGSNFFSMEVVSRVMNFTKPTPCPLNQIYPCTGEPLEWDYKTEINAILSIIHAAFSGPGFHACTNLSTGLHVHLGNGSLPPPERTSIYMYGIFAALEHLFEQCFPVSRILSYKDDATLPSINRPSPVWCHDDSGQTPWCAPISNGMIEKIWENILDAVEDEDDHQLMRSNVKNELQRMNAFDFYKTITSFDTLHALREQIPCRRACAVNLTNLMNQGMGKQTIEIRSGGGSLDKTEVLAWIDLLGKLTLWITNPNIDHDTIIKDLWSNPARSIIDLVQHINASSSTLSFYTHRLSPNWAQHRHDTILNKIPICDPFKRFRTVVENNRLRDYRSRAVNSQMQKKLQGGCYGQFPSDFLKANLWSFAAELTNGDNSDGLILSQDACDYEKWTDDAIVAATADIAAISDGR
jgi:hypothetical protein